MAHNTSQECYVCLYRNSLHCMTIHEASSVLQLPYLGDISHFTRHVPV